jgi:hypothetical protein
VSDKKGGPKAALSITATIVRPATFMEMLVMPGFWTREASAFSPSRTTIRRTGAWEYANA